MTDIWRLNDGDQATSLRTRARHAAFFVLLFAFALALMRIVPPEAAASYPNPLWLPVILISLNLGLGAGLFAALVATGLLLWSGLPPQIWTEDVYQYAARVSWQPVGWSCLAMLIGYLRRHQIAELAEMKAELAERIALCQTISDRCEELRQRSEMLERQVAATSPSAPRDPLAKSADELARRETA